MSRLLHTAALPVVQTALVAVWLPFLAGVALSLTLHHPSPPPEGSQFPFFNTWLTGAAVLQLWVRLSLLWPALLAAPDWEAVRQAPHPMYAAASALTPALFGLVTFVGTPFLTCRVLLASFDPELGAFLYQHSHRVVLAVLLLCRTATLLIRAVPEAVSALAAQALDHQYLEGVRLRCLTDDLAEARGS
eukprot:EG_transcript_24300